MKKMGIVLVVAAVLIAAAVWFFVGRGNADGTGGIDKAGMDVSSNRTEVVGKVHSKGDTRIRKPTAMNNEKKKRQRKEIGRITMQEQEVKPEPALDESELAKMTTDEIAAFKALQAAFDEEKLTDAIAAVERLSQCKSVEARSEIVSMLGWFGKRAMPELTPYMADPDPDVASDATDSWIEALSELEGERKAQLVEQAMMVLTEEDKLDEIATELFSDVPNSVVLRTLINVIENGNQAAVAAAKENYEFFTGDEFTTVEAAQEWLNENPDEEE